MFSVAQWQAIGHHSSGNCPGFTPDSLLSPQGTPQIGGKSKDYFYTLTKTAKILFWAFAIYKNVVILRPVWPRECRENRQQCPLL